MKHLRQHYETVYDQLYKETGQEWHLIERPWSNWELINRINRLLKHFHCIPYTQEELYTISDSME